MQRIRKLFSLTIVILFVSGMALADWKIKQKVTMQGRGSETTIYVKGSRKRTEGGGIMGIGADVATIEQCDMRRYIKVNDSKKQYFITPFTDSDEPAPAKKTPKGNSFVESAAEGTVTYIYSIIDTGERQQMFGLTARHIKTTMTIQSSPDACTKQDMEMKMDGWYVDLPDFSCPVTERPTSPDMSRGTDKGCHDKVITKTTGSGKLGFPLTETRTFGTGASAFTQTTETLEFSRDTLAAALFDIPQGYTLAKKEQDLYGMPNMADMAAIANNMGGQTGQATSSSAKKEGFKRVGVLMPENKSGAELTMSNIQSFLTNVIRAEKVEAVPIASAADAASAQCDFVFSSEVTKLKQSALGMMGGILGKATGVPTGSQKYETQIGYSLSKLDGTQVLNKQSSLKTNGTPESVVQAAYSQAMGDVMKAINK